MNKFNIKNNYNLYMVLAAAAAVITIAVVAVLAANGSKSKGKEPSYSAESYYTENESVLESEAVQSFTVAITDADGVWNRTQVKKSDAATLTVSEQNESGFKFAFVVTVGDTSAKLSGESFFVSENSAQYTYGECSLMFTFQSDSITVAHNGDQSELGCTDSFTFDGSYTKGEAVYTDDLVKDEYSADIRKSTMCISALKGCMTGSDYEKMNYIFENGQEYVYENDEHSYDKDGKEINVDSELKAVKYYADIAGSGEHVILICTNGGKVYAAVVSEGELRYYTNDSAYYYTAPKAFTTAAESYEVKIKYMSK